MRRLPIRVAPAALFRAARRRQREASRLGLAVDDLAARLRARVEAHLAAHVRASATDLIGGGDHVDVDAKSGDEGERRNLHSDAVFSLLINQVYQSTVSISKAVHLFIYSMSFSLAPILPHGKSWTSSPVPAGLSAGAYYGYALAGG